MADNAASSMKERNGLMLITEPVFSKNAVVYRRCPFSPLKVPVGRVKDGYECLIGSRLQCDTDRTVCSEYLSARAKHDPA